MTVTAEHTVLNRDLVVIASLPSSRRRRSSEVERANAKSVPQAKGAQARELGRREEPARLFVAVPIAARQTCDAFRTGGGRNRLRRDA